MTTYQQQLFNGQGKNWICIGTSTDKMQLIEQCRNDARVLRGDVMRVVAIEVVYETGQPS